ncbi:hypothetical protein F383_09824 [Gossypium arboreum]|uniref:Uncharacterized protein n=1 Tax=Gossypium arboreum TaxID=29729 RepID=A0A0B0PGV7_GOSAR|nr:hypothetical protein F383_09824 [Gossypium arboreum]
MLHGHVSLSIEIELNSVCSTWSHTLVCDWPYGTGPYTP